MSAQQERVTALWRDATPAERRALREHVSEPLPLYLRGLLAGYGLPATVDVPPGRPPAQVMPAPVVAWVSSQSCT
jgi:hypothetical protein